MLLLLFNDTATTEMYTLSLRDALPISDGHVLGLLERDEAVLRRLRPRVPLRHLRVRRELHRHASADRFDVHALADLGRSEEHTSELQSRQYLVCRLLLDKKYSYSEKIF